MKKFDDLKSAILKQLKQDYPEWDDVKLNSKAEEIAMSQMKKKMSTKKMEKKDSDGYIIVGENVKLILEANIASVGVVEE
jgi:hypothetical protein